MPARRRHRPPAGTATIEFALVLTVFFAFLFAIMELARAIYLFNAVQEVTRRASALAAISDFSNASTMTALRKRAVFDDTAGALPLGAPVTEAYVRIDYLSIARDAGGALSLADIATVPSSPARNRYNCLVAPYDSGCIRLVRARICDPADTTACNPVRYRPVFPLIALDLTLPTAPTIVTAESLGFVPGLSP